MGLLKKIFKPVSKVLDKIVPNEVKPFLPYAAAFAPMFAPGIMGAFGGSALSRAAIGGGLNIFGQLSQEGNEGDINLLSAGLGALTGAMTTPGKQIGVDKFDQPIFDRASSASGIFREKAAAAGADTLTGKGLETLAKGSDIFAAGMRNPISMAGLKAAALPAATATGDLMFAQAKRDQDDYDRMMEEESESEYASDASRALAIRQSMEAYGFTEEEILAAIEAAGYKAGGRVGFDSGGSGTKSMNEIRVDEIMTIAKDIRENNDVSYGEASDLADIIDYYKYGKGQFETYTGDNPIIKFHLNIKNEEARATGGRVGLEFGGMPGALAATALKEEDKSKYITKKDDIEIMNRIFTEGGHEGLNAYIEKNPELTDKYVNIMVNQDDEVIAIPNQLYDMENMLEIQGGDGSGIILLNNEMFENKAKGGRVGAEEGGLMNLGGKEMDMRGGGFIPIGKKERADDVPARLSKNEFVMTADAVRAAGGGSVNKGAKRMYDVMNKLEAKA